MEAVRAFNNELSGLYETKPPVSRAKMAQVTKGAIKAIKYYKHVVQSVEKFIQKCKPEYKVPGLYVIDSVVRQSRHQFGAPKDVFAPRFTKNIITTFQNLFKCPGEERSKIVRVLNLWQKNDVFPSEIVQPLLDLAADPTKPSLLAAAQAAVDRVLAASGKSSGSSVQQPQQQQQQQQPSAGDSMDQAAAENMLATQNDMLNTVTQLLQQTNSGNTSLSAQQQQLQQLQLLQQQLIQQTALMQQPSGGAPLIDANLLAQIQALTNQLLQKTETKPDEGGFNKKLLDFDYGESDEEEEKPNTQEDVQTILNDTGLMQQIHQVSQTIQKNNSFTAELSDQESRRKLLEQEQAEFDNQIAQPPAPGATEFQQEEGEYTEEVQDEDFREHQQFRDRDDRDRRERRRKSRDRSRSRTPKRRRKTRSRSRDRRRRSRSRDRHRRSRSKDRERREKERERKKKGLPLVRGNFVTICTTTIWIGHLNKFTTEEELKTELERYGPVDNINMVPPRGCAYIVMSNRKDAYKAIDRLKGHKLNGSALKTAWAQSTGIRESEFKDSWDLDEGAMYIPWDNVPKDLSNFLEGGIIDGESLPENLKEIATEKVKGDASGQTTSSVAQTSNPAAMMTMAGQHMPQMPGQPPLMGMMGNMPPMPGMMRGMMMPMQRPVVPGMPPQAMQMTPGAPPQMMPGAQVPTIPGVRPPGVLPQMPAMSIPSTAAANSLAQTIQNIMSTTAGVMPSSPSVPPRPSGFTPGMSPAGPPRFGFNPNMPPPGFRLPPPGFGSPMRPPMGAPNNVPPSSKPSETNQLGERLSALAGQGMKQPEMAWPPDSNEKDDEMEEDEDMNEDRSELIQTNTSLPPGQFGRGQGMPPPMGPDQLPMRMMGPLPPGGFPPGGAPGPPNQPWNINPRMGRGRHMRPQMGGPMGNPDMFGGPMRMGGPMGPPFMGGPGFPRFGGPMGPNSGNMRGPVSLMDLDVKPVETFKGEAFNNEDEDELQNEEDGEDEFPAQEEENNDDTQENDMEPNDDRSNMYPFNTWKSVSRDGNRERHDGRDRSFRGRDRDRDDNDRDRRDSRDRDGHRSRDRRRSRERDRSRDLDRGDRDNDWKRRDDRHDDRQDRGRDRDPGDRDRGDRERDRGDRERNRGDRDRPRKSRWGDFEEEKQIVADKIQATETDKKDSVANEEENKNIVENSGEPSETVEAQASETVEAQASDTVEAQASDTVEAQASDTVEAQASDTVEAQAENVNTNSNNNSIANNAEDISENKDNTENETNENTENETIENTENETIETSETNVEATDSNKENIEQNENVIESSQNNGPVNQENTAVSENKIEEEKSTTCTESVDMDLEEGEIPS